MDLSVLSVVRPIFATVMSLLLIIFGFVSFYLLPLRELPDISRPVVSISTTYRGASAEIVENRITVPIEEQISGIEGIDNITSTSQDGLSNIVIEFSLERDIDDAANDVRDRVARAIRSLPDEVDQPVVTKADSNSQPIMWVTLTSDTLDSLQLTDYVSRNLVDRFSILPGVASVRIGGERRYVMRIWIDPSKLQAYNVTVNDIESALQRENVEFPSGRIESLEREFTVRVPRLYETADDFKELVILRNNDGNFVRMGDVANVEIGSEDIRSYIKANGKNVVGLGIVQQSKANTLEVARAVKREIIAVEPTLPDKTYLRTSYDSSIFIEQAIAEVYETIIIAIFLVLFVIYLFLGNLSMTAIPAVTVPVSIIASYIVLYMFGYSVNLLTLLAVVLAIGLVVDDAIVVMENIYRRLEEGEPPLLAAARGVKQIQFAVISITLVLIAVFTPVAFLQDDVGRLFREFAFALSGAVAFSAFVALTLSPMMCAKLLNTNSAHSKSGLAARFDVVFKKTESAYKYYLDAALNNPKKIMALFIFCISFIVLLYEILPKQLLPNEDRGVVLVAMQAPEGASIEYSTKYMNQIEDILLDYQEQGVIRNMIIRVPGNFNSTESVNSGIGILLLEDWGKRDLSSQMMQRQLFGKFSAIDGVLAIPILPKGFGQSGLSPSVEFVIGGSSYKELAEWRDKLIPIINENKGLVSVQTDYRETKPQQLVVVDRDKAASLGVSLRQIGQTLETALAGKQITTYLDRGEEYDVIVEVPKELRSTPQDLNKIYVRSEINNQLIPLSNVVKTEEYADAATLNRYNRRRALTISANLAPGYSLGQALEFLEEISKENLPSTATYDYKNESKYFKTSTNVLIYVFIFALTVVFLLLSAQFESFVHPLIIMMTVPLAILGALIGLFLAGDSLNVYSQIGIIMLIGLSAKNGILIVEFANQLRDSGYEFLDALKSACIIRYRPILMTSIATAMGAVPLLFATGAGAESRYSLGVVIFGGVVVTTFFTLFVVPTFYLVLAKNTKSPEALTRELIKLESNNSSKKI